MDLKGKRALILGMGETGLAMSRWLSRQGVRLRIADSRQQPPNMAALHAISAEAELHTGAFDPAILAGIDLVALSPGVPVQEALVQHALASGLPVVSEIELFARAVRKLTPRAKIIAITGSNGKTTTTALVGALCSATGHNTAVAGNISPAALDALMAALDANDMPDIWVLELSSFQLERTFSLHADAATVLNVSEDHLDRYSGMADYAEAKARVFMNGSGIDGVMVLNRDDDLSLASGRCGRKMLTFGLNPAPRSCDYGLADGFIVRGKEQLIAVDALTLVGLHNAANAMAALALCEAIGIPPSEVLPALAEFKGLPHRVEWITQINGVDYYDDSKGTNVGATLAALQGLGRKVAVILGGEGKEQDFSPLNKGISEHARAVALIGRDADKIARSIMSSDVPMQRCADMSTAVTWCATQALPGDAVLLSPACASFDMFRNYAHRSEVFIEAVCDFERRSA